MSSFSVDLVVSGIVSFLLLGFLLAGWVLGKWSHPNPSDFEKPYEDMKQLVHSLSDMNVQLINQLRSNIPASYNIPTQPKVAMENDPIQRLQEEFDYAMSGGQ